MLFFSDVLQLIKVGKKEREKERERKREIKRARRSGSYH